MNNNVMIMNIKNIVMQNTDLTFLISDYLDDTSSKSLFKSQRLYHNMITNNPHRYKVKRTVSLMKIHKLLEREEGVLYTSESDGEIEIEFFVDDDTENFYSISDILRFTLKDNKVDWEFSKSSSIRYEKLDWFKELILLIKDYILSYGITSDMMIF